MRGAFLIVLALLIVESHALQAGPQSCPALPQPRLIAPESEIPPVPHGQGLLWKIELPGTRPSYLFGTIHLEDPRITTLPPPVRNAFDRAQSFSMEVIMHPAARATFAESIYMTGQTSLRDYLDGALFARLARLAKNHYAIPEHVLEHMKPWAVFTILSRPRPQTGRVLDHELQDQALAQGKPVYGLETVEELIAALDGIPTDQQIKILVDTVCNYDLIAAQIEELTELYQKRDLAAMMALTARAHTDEILFEALINRIVYQRNERMVERITPRLAEGNAFIAVGAAHLAGTRGLLTLLEKRGLRVSPIY
jgi:Uncharacterized protein conserved in bacteria